MTDKDLRRDVLEALDAAQASRGQQIGVAVGEGIVTLSGHVASYSEKAAIERAVLQVKGVRALAGQVAVCPEGMARSQDETLAARVATTLERDLGIDAGSVAIKVEGGAVTLQGSVTCPTLKSTLGRAVGALHGVRGVIDLVTIPPKAREGVVKAAILDVLERASTDPDTIDVTLDGDRVILDGSVRAWGERELAEQAAWSVPGVCSVEDHLSLGR